MTSDASELLVEWVRALRQLREFYPELQQEYEAAQAALAAAGSSSAAHVWRYVLALEVRMIAHGGERTAWAVAVLAERARSTRRTRRMTTTTGADGYHYTRGGGAVRTA
jgi:hypothetical protein